MEHPIQQLFLAISANLDLKNYGGDAKYAFAHSPAPSVLTFVTIDNQYADWYKSKFGRQIDQARALPVMRALQVHPESGKLWEKHINNILFSDELNFKTTTRDWTIYKTIHKGKIVFLLRQVDAFALACKEESTAKEIYDIISRSLRLEKEPCDPFSYLGIVKDFKWS